MNEACEAILQEWGPGGGLARCLAGRDSFPFSAFDESGRVIQWPGTDFFDSIIWLVAGDSRIKFEDIMGRSRHAHIADARHLAMYLCYNVTPSWAENGWNISAAMVGRIFERDGTTVDSALNKIVNRIAERPFYAKRVRRLRKALETA